MFAVTNATPSRPPIKCIDAMLLAFHGNAQDVNYDEIIMLR